MLTNKGERMLEIFFVVRYLFGRVKILSVLLSPSPQIARSPPLKGRRPRGGTRPTFSPFPEPRNESIGKFYVVRKRRSTDLGGFKTAICLGGFGRRHDDKPGSGSGFFQIKSVNLSFLYFPDQTFSQFQERILQKVAQKPRFLYVLLL